MDRIRSVLGVAVLVVLLAVAATAAAAAKGPTSASVRAAGLDGWQKQTAPSAGDDLFGVSFVDATHGWAVGQGGQNGVAIATSDGIHWAAEALPAGTGVLNAVDFVDATNGWAVGNGSVVGTADGGATWVTQSWPAGIDSSTSQLKGVDFVDASHGWAVGRRTDTTAAVIIATTDGGATWVGQTVPVGVATLYDVEFVDALCGWAVGCGPAISGPSAGVVLATTDGGATWTPQSVPTGRVDALFSVSALDADHCWIGGTRMVLVTSDGGSSWTKQGESITGQQQGICFVDAAHGWAVGRDGIIATSDGGATWREQIQPPSSGVLSDIAAVDPSHAWCVGRQGTLLATSNGGFLPRPEIVKLSRTSGRRGAVVIIRGTGFQPSRGTGYVKFGATKVAKYIAWTAKRIKCRVPAKAKYGKQRVVVVTGGGTSKAKAFRVRR